MAETRDQDGPDQDGPDQDGPDQDGPDQATRDAETAKLELPSFRGFGRKRRDKRAPESPAAPRVETASQDYTEPLMTDDQRTRVDAVLEPVDQQDQPVRQRSNGHADDPSDDAAHPTRTAVPTQADETDPDHEPADHQSPAATTERRTQRTTQRTPLALPQVDGRIAAAVTGAVVGLVGCALTFLALTGCDAVRGTKTCGGGPGSVILLLILAGMVVLGALVLSLWRQAEPRAASFLGVGVLFVVMLLVLQDQLLSPWMFLVVPVVTALGFVAGHWVTTAFVEKVPEKGPQHDVR